MVKKKKRKYTFRKGQIIPYESGSLIHEIHKMTKGFYENKKRKRRKRRR